MPSAGYDIMMRNYNTSAERWVPAAIFEHHLPHSVLVKSDKCITRRHSDKLRKRVARDTPPRMTHNDDDADLVWLVPSAAATPAAIYSPESNQPLRRSQRRINPPNRLIY